MVATTNGVPCWQVAVVTDSTAYLPSELSGTYDLTVVPLTVVINGAEGLEGEEISPAEVAHALSQRRVAVSTSRPAPEQFAAAYRRLLHGTCPVVVVPNALPHGVSTRRSSLTRPVAVAAGSLIQRKGFDLLIDAWAPIAHEHPEWHLRIFGVGDQSDELAERVRRLGLTGTVHLPGFAGDLAGEFDAASLFVLSSRREGMPMVLIEAMAAGLPVVAFDCPTGPADVLGGGRFGVLVPVGDVAALTDALRGVITDSWERRRLADLAVDRARDFDPNATASRWEELFTRLADERGLPVGR